MKKILIIIFFLCSVSHGSISIIKIAKVDDQIITNIDIINEIEIMKLIFKRQISLNENTINIAKNNLIEEMLKKNEIKRKKIESNVKLIDEKYDNLLQNFKKEEIIISKYLQKLIYQKIKLEFDWNLLISKNYSWQVNVNMEEINKKIENLQKNNASSKEILKEKEKLISIEKNKKIQVYSQMYIDKLKEKSLIFFYK